MTTLAWSRMPELSHEHSVIELIVAPFFDNFSKWEFDKDGFHGHMWGRNFSRILVDIRGDGSDVLVGHQCMGEGWTTWWYELNSPTSINRIRDKLEEILKLHSGGEQSESKEDRMA